MGDNRKPKYTGKLDFVRSSLCPLFNKGLPAGKDDKACTAFMQKAAASANGANPTSCAARFNLPTAVKSMSSAATYDELTNQVDYSSSTNTDCTDANASDLSCSSSDDVVAAPDSVAFTPSPSLGAGGAVGIAVGCVALIAGIKLNYFFVQYFFLVSKTFSFSAIVGVVVRKRLTRQTEVNMAKV